MRKFETKEGGIGSDLNIVQRKFRSIHSYCDPLEDSQPLILVFWIGKLDVLSKPNKGGPGEDPGSQEDTDTKDAVA